MLYSTLVAASLIAHPLPAAAASPPPISLSQSGHGTLLVTANRGAPSPERIVVPYSVLGLESDAELELIRAPHHSPPRILVVDADGVQREHPAVPITLYRADSNHPTAPNAFLAIGPTMSLGWIDLPNGERRAIGTPPPQRRAGGLVPGIPACMADATPHSVASGAGSPLANRPADTMLTRLAVETDYEYRMLFDTTAASIEYAEFVYAAVDDIFRREMNSRLPLVFLRIWETPDDLFNQPSPLGNLRDWWNDNMDSVEREAVQFFSGRRNLPYGGSAFLSALCTSNHYSVVGYAMGFSGDLGEPSVFNYDVHVTAHELGHNFGTLHTHDYDIDNCLSLSNTPVRGGIMSYCSQTVSGGNAVTDLRFHTLCQSYMRDHLSEVQDCLGRDCNGNGVADETDIADGSSLDVNGNAVPDSCEDCNANGVLDPADIASGTSSDHDENAVPDECQLDCNSNGIPDTFDIATGTSEDVWGNGVPDECEVDCDGDGVYDYNQLQVDMRLDTDRDLVLDTCADCDLDGISDLDELDGAWGAWIATLSDGQIHQVHPVVGTVLDTGGTPGLESLSWDLVVTPGRRIIASSPVLDLLQVCNDRGEVLALWSTGSTLRSPRGMAIRGRDLLVCGNHTNNVARFDLPSGRFLGDVVSPGEGGLTGPLSIHIRDDGVLLVADERGAVLAFDGETGESLGDLVSASENGGLDGPRGMEITTDGRLLVASFVTNQVLSYNASTGEFLGQFNNGGTDTALTMDQPWGVRRGPLGDIHISRANAGPGGDPGGHDHDHNRYEAEG
ncbi:MAG: M12 family metallo-peptidase, partial [Phycisphaerales bacterium]|nr:M12 family metallo-peptidase [Phycisphaerales bacterium]